MIITLASSKGGVGKSTTTAALAGTLAHAGHRVHIVDLDSNHTVSRWLGDGRASPRLTVSAADPQDFDAIVAGVDYVTGPYKLGLSYMDGTQEQGLDPISGAKLADMDIERWTAGVVYEWGPGMTFRGAVQYQENEDILGDTDEDFEGTQVTLGTQLNF